MGDDRRHAAESYTMPGGRGRGEPSGARAQREGRADDGRAHDRGRAGLRSSLWQFVKFALVGGSGVLVNLAVFRLTLLVWHGHSEAAVYTANSLGFIVSVVTNYLLNRRWTFRSDGRMASEFPKFLTVSLVAYALNVGVFTLFYHQLGLDPTASQVIAIVFVMPVNYLFNRFWSFRPARTPEHV